MRVTIKDSDALGTISHKDLENYLKKNEWDHVSEYKKDQNIIGKIYKKYSNRLHKEDFVYVLTEHTDDYIIRMAENFATIESIENESQLQIYVDITGKEFILKPNR